MKKRIWKLMLSAMIVISIIATSVLPANAAGWYTSYTVKLSYTVGGTAIIEDNNSQPTKSVRSGSTVKFLASPNPYYRLKGWYDGEELLGNELQLVLTNVRKNRNIEAEFEYIYDKYYFDHVHDGWTAWSAPDSLPTEAGDYYLTTDVTINGPWEAPNGVALCLNGHILRNTAESAPVTVNTRYQVVITDCMYWDDPRYYDVDGLGAWKLREDGTETPYSTNGGVITGVDRCLYVNDNGSLHMFGGNCVGASGNKSGPGVSVSDYGLFYMYSGTIQGNVHHYTGKDTASKPAVKEYDGGGGMFIDIGAQVYIGGDSIIAYNSTLYSNNGGGIYNYCGTVILDDYPIIMSNKGQNGVANDYYAYIGRDASTSGTMYLRSSFDPEEGRIGINSIGDFTSASGDDYSYAFFSDRADYEVTSDSDYVHSLTKKSTSGKYLVTAGTQGAGSTKVNNANGKYGVLVDKNSNATLVATPVNSDYMFVGWYSNTGALLTTNPTYTISSVKSATNVLAKFMPSDGMIQVNNSGAIQVFNSGEDEAKYGTTGPKSYYKNTALGTIDNNGRYIYMDTDSGFDKEGPIGKPFTINGKVLEKSFVTMNAFDVDQKSGEVDEVWLYDLTDYTSVKLGKLTGMNREWNTTTFDIAPELLEEGHTYQLYMKDTVKGWIVWVDTASITIGAMEAQALVLETIDASVTAIIDNNGKVTPTLNVTSFETATYNVEFKATHIETVDQRGSLLDATIDAVADTEVSKDYSFDLSSGSPKGAYRIDAYILDSDGNVLKTVSCTAGYDYYTVNYDANGGTNNVPEDTTAYEHNDPVTVLFDYIPSRVRQVQSKARAAAVEYDKFVGWDTDPNATTAAYTKDGDNDFNITEDTTLYAVYHTHTPGEAVIENEVEPTCTTDGSYDEVVKCLDCGEELSRTTVVDYATGHTMGEWQIVTPATDDTDGLKRQDCTKCDYYITEVIPKNGHSYDAVVTAPTCTEQGYTTYTCTNSDCGDVIVADYVPALGHDEEIIPGKAATCTETGLTDGKKCTRCGIITVEQTVTEALGHNHVVVGTSNANCIESGFATYTCTRCGDTYSEEVSEATGIHQYNTEDDIVVPPTCTEDGFTQHVCSVCGHIENDTVVAKLGHDMGEWIIDKYPTCEEEGSQHRDCQRDGCTYSETQMLEMVDHTFGDTVRVEPTCTEDGSETQTCSVCGETVIGVIPATGHTESEWITVNPTATEPGKRYTECTICNEILQTVNLYLISTDINIPEAGTVSEAVVVEEGGSASISATANKGYRFIGWYDGDTLVSENAEYTVENVNACKTYIAKFEKKLETAIAVVRGYVPAGEDRETYGYALLLTTAIDSLNYKMAGFEFTVNGKTYVGTTNKVCQSIKITLESGDTILRPELYGEGNKYLVYHRVNFSEEAMKTIDENSKITIRSFVVTKEGEKIYTDYFEPNILYPGYNA